MIKLYGSARSSAARCMWLMEEMGVPYETITLNMREGEHKSPEYLKLNPNGKVPTLIDGDFVLYESFAINHYLARKYMPTLLGEHEEEDGLILQWTFWAVLHIQHNFEPMAYAAWKLDTVTPELEVKHTNLVNKFLGILDKQLEGKKYILGDRFSLADINLHSCVNFGAAINFNFSPFPNLQRWLKSLEERPALQKIRALQKA